MKKILLIVVLLVSFLSSVNAQVKKVQGTYKLNFSENKNMTIADAERKCEQLAKLDAIKKEFGSDLNEQTLKELIQHNDEAQSHFYQLIQQSTNAVWLNDTKQPKYTYKCEDNQFFITCEVCGEAMQKENFNIDLNWKILGGNADIKSERTTINNEEHLFIYVKSPSDGYIAVFLQDAEGETYCLLPYWDAEPKFYIERGKEYFLFDTENHKDLRYKFRYQLKTESEIEANKIYLVFSKNEFALPLMKPIASTDSQVRISKCAENFGEWLVEKMTTDDYMRLFGPKFIKILGNSNKY